MHSPDHDFVLVNEDDVTGSDQSGLQPLHVKELLVIYKWLQPTDYSAESSEYHRHLSSHVSGTTEWTQKPQYQQWMSSKDQGALWVKAIAGAGNSVAAAYVASRLQKTKPVPSCFISSFAKSSRATGRQSRCYVTGCPSFWDSVHPCSGE